VKRLHRRITAWLALFAICFVQIATAAHACALVDGAFGAPAVQAEATSPCADMGMGTSSQDKPALCFQHCKPGQQLLDHNSPVVAADGPDIVPLIVASCARADIRSVITAPDIAPGTSPPRFAASARLRI